MGPCAGEAGEGVEHGSGGGIWAREVPWRSGEHWISDEAKNTLNAGVISVSRMRTVPRAGHPDDSDFFSLFLTFMPNQYFC